MIPLSFTRPVRRIGILLALLAITPVQAQQTRWPVISKVRIVFSMVSHHNTIQDRVAFYNTSGDPKGNAHYAVPHLVYEPVVTLYNPYPDTLVLNRCRVRLSDPPVGFSIKKNDQPLRHEFGWGQFHGLGRFQIQNEQNASARKIFILNLTSPDASGMPGDPIVLQPGESRDFSTWVENNWSWGLETSPTNGRAFFDWAAHENFTNRDGRTGNLMGVETTSLSSPGLWDYRAGFQTDSLSLSTTRPAATFYDFEAGAPIAHNFVVIKLTDTFTVLAKTMRTATGQSDPDFRVEMLRGTNANADQDIHRTYAFNMGDIVQDPESPVVLKTYQVGTLLQKPDDLTRGGKTPFAMLSIKAKPAALQANNFYQTPAVPSADLYDVRFDEMDGYPSLGFPAIPGEEPALKILSTVRTGNTMTVDFAGDPGIDAWRVMGTADLANGFTEDLTAVSEFIPGTAGSGIQQVIVDVSGKGDVYFVRVESAEN